MENCFIMNFKTHELTHLLKKKILQAIYAKFEYSKHNSTF